MRYHRRSPGRAAFGRLTVLVLAIALICGLLAPAFQADADQIKVVKIGYYENEIFEEGAREGAVKYGYAYEYYLKLSEYTGWKYEYVYGSYTELYQMLVDGKIDLLAGLAYKEERLEEISYPDVPMGNEDLILVKHDSDTDITSDPKTMKGLKFGVLKSAIKDTLKDYMAEKGIEAEVITYEYYDDLFSDFDNNKLDILAAEGYGASKRDHAEVVCSFAVTDFYLGVNKSRPDLLEELNTALTQLYAYEPNYQDSLREKHYSFSITSRAFTAQEKEWLASHDKLTVGYFDDYLPYSDTDKNGEATGLIVEYLPAVLNALDISDLKVEYKGYKSYKDMIDDLCADVIDTAFPVGGGLYYSEENGIYQSAAVVKSTMELAYLGKYTKDTTKRFAVNENNLMQYYYILTNFPEAEIDFYPSIDECLEAVKGSKASCTLLNGMSANDILRESKYDMLSVVLLSTLDDRSFGVKIGNENLLKLLNRGVKSLGPDYAQSLAYRYQSAIKKYTFSDVFKDYLPLFIVIILLMSAVVIIFLIRDVRRRKKEAAIAEEARIEVEEKNKELAESQSALRDALDAAEYANRAKSMFLNNMSHDIRTPMNAIVGFTAMASAHIDNKEMVEDYLGKITISSRHLLSLINDVLDMSRIESGKMVLELTDVHLPDLIHDLRAIIHSSVSSKQLELSIDTKDVVNEDIVADKLRLCQMLLNILTNAVKFTPPGGSIGFTVTEKPCSTEGRTLFEFRIKDNGIGMSEEFKKKIFDPFTREQTSTVSGIQGTGLGMAISKNIVDMMGGTISVDSAVGEGTEFIVDIPFDISSKKTEYAVIPELEGLRALVADNNADTCVSVCAMLRTMGMRPDWTSSGREAVIRAKDAYDQGDLFKVYIIDWTMSDLNGIETVRRIRGVIGDSDPVIVLTAYDRADIEEEAKEAGVTAFCSKPLFMSELRNVLLKPFRVEPQKTEKAEDKPDFSGKRVLVAEDNEMNQMIAQSILENLGFTVEVVSDGVEAVEKVKFADAGYYYAILMDIQMPKMDGYEATARIRAFEDKEKARVPIIAVTANAFEEDRRSSLDAGMDGHLAKPYDIPAMKQMLSSIADGNGAAE